MRYCFYFVSFIVLILISGRECVYGQSKSVIAVQGAIFKGILENGLPENVDEAYSDLEAIFFSNQQQATSWDWSTFIALTKTYTSFCIRNSNYERAEKTIRKILSGNPPEIFVSELIFLLESLNPNKESMQVTALKLRNLFKQSLRRGFSFEEKLLVSAYETFAQESLTQTYEQIFTHFYLNDYLQAHTLCSKTIDYISCDDILIPTSVKIPVLSDLLRLKRKAEIHLMDSETLFTDKIDIICRYLTTSVDSVHQENLFLNRLQEGKIPENAFVDGTLLRIGRRLYKSRPEVGISVLECLINQGRRIRNSETRDALSDLLSIYLIRNDEKNMRRLLSFVQESLCIGDPLREELYFYRGWLFYREGRFRESIGEFKTSLVRSTTTGQHVPDALLYLGKIHLHEALNALRDGANAHVFLMQAEDCFFTAYKSRKREEGGIGYFICLSLQKEALLTTGINPEQFLKEHFCLLSPRGKEICRSFTEIFLPELKHLVSGGTFFFNRENRMHRFLTAYFENGSNGLDMVEKELLRFRLTDSDRTGDDLIELFGRIIQWKLHRQIDHFEKTCSSEPFLIFLKAMKDDEIPTELLIREISENNILKSEMKEILIGYLILKRQEEVSFGEYLRHQQGISCFIFNNYNDFLPEVLRQNCLDSVAYTQYSDLTYFKLYSPERYLDSSDAQVREHLNCFPNLFPKSDLIPIVFFLLGFRESDPELSLGYFSLSLEAFRSLSFDERSNGLYAYFYCRACIETAKRLLDESSPEGCLKAIGILEKFKEEMATNHPWTAQVKKSELGIFFQKECIRYLIRGYVAIFEKDLLLIHILDCLDIIVLDSDFTEEVLTTLKRVQYDSVLD